ncbi:unnamed protein product, partial [Medioppia subpectinata]
TDLSGTTNFLVLALLVTDLSGTTNFLVLALLVLTSNETYFTRQIVVTALTTIWSLRLGTFLTIRVLIRHSDNRFDRIRDKFWPFLYFWCFQMVWVFAVSLPVTLTNASVADCPLNSLDLIGWTLWAVGFAIETVADHQKFAHNMLPVDSRPPFLATGLWSVSRHPNYFGEIILWTGIFITSCNVYSIAANDMAFGYYLSAVSPVLTFLLLSFVSGIPLAEKKSDKRCAKLTKYKDYKRTTSPLIPFPPNLYKHLPNFVKVLLFLDF